MIAGEAKCKHCGNAGHFTKLCLRWQGHRFGSLLVLRGAPRAGSQTSLLCLCDCGTEKTIRLGHLTAGKVKSCGCARVSGKARITKESAPNVVNVYGEAMTIGQLATVSGKRPDQLWAQIRAGKDPEEAAFGVAVAANAATAREAIAVSTSGVPVTARAAAARAVQGVRDAFLGTMNDVRDVVERHKAAAERCMLALNDTQQLAIGAMSPAEFAAKWPEFSRERVDK